MEPEKQLSLTDTDHPIWMLMTGAVVAAVSALTLWGNYNHFDPPRDLLTISQVCAAYFAFSLGKRMVHMKQRKAREDEEAKTPIVHPEMNFP